MSDHKAGYTDGYEWIDHEGPVYLITSLQDLDWLVEVINETTNE